MRSKGFCQPIDWGNRIIKAGVDPLPGLVFSLLFLPVVGVIPAAAVEH